MVAVAVAAAFTAIILPRPDGAEPLAAVGAAAAESPAPLLQRRDTPSLEPAGAVSGVAASPAPLAPPTMALPAMTLPTTAPPTSEPLAAVGANAAEPAPSLRLLLDSSDWIRRALAFVAAVRETLPQQAAAATPPAEQPVPAVAAASVPTGKPVTVDAAESTAPALPAAQPEYFSPPSVVSVVASAPAPPPAPEAPVLSPREEGLLREMNREREQFGLEPLVASAVLTGIARARSRDMTEQQYFGHFHPDGISVYALLQAAGVRYAAGGENLAKVAGDVEHSVRSAIEALMESDSHRENILNPRYRFIGVGSVTDDSGITILTAVFTDR